jgi:hypothetical protein
MRQIMIDDPEAGEEWGQDVGHGPLAQSPCQLLCWLGVRVEEVHVGGNLLNQALIMLGFWATLVPAANA